VRPQARPLPPLAPEKGVEIEHHPPFQHVIDGPGQLMHENRPCLALAVFFLQPTKVFLARGMRPQKQDRSFGEGPREIRVTDLSA
jgi:hypothetical protein